MGKLGELFGLAVYLGTSGLNTYLKMQSGEIKSDAHDAAFTQKCLILTYDDRNYLSKEDLQLVKQLELKLRGKNAWPSFRNYEPGYFPWYLNRDEVLYFTQIIEQAKDVCLRFKEDKNLLHQSPKGQYLVRTSQMKETGLSWIDEWREPAPLPKEEPYSVLIDEIRLQRIKKSAKNTDMIWDIDYFFSPTPIKEEKMGRPYFPYATPVLEHESGFMLNIELMHPEEYKKKLPNSLFAAIEKTSQIPAQIMVRKEEALKLLEPITTKLNIKLKLVKKMPHMDEAQNGMMEYFC